MPELKMESAYKPVTQTSNLTTPDYSKASSGMALEMPSYVGEGNYKVPEIETSAKEYEVFDSEWLDKFTKEQADKYIGATPKKIGTTAGGESAIKLGEPVKTDTVSSEGTDFGDTMGTIGGQAASAVADISRAKANIAQNQRLADLRTWQEQGKYWFDPNQDLRPDLEQYIEEMPRATEALAEGTLTGGELSESSAGRAFMGVGSLGISELFDDKSQAEYIWSKGGEGALSGSSGGWIGTVVGAAIGVIEGVFTWESAKEEDEERERKARAEYERTLKQWTINKNKRLVAQRQAATQQEEAMEAARKDEKAGKDAQQIKNVTDMRNKIANAFVNANSLSKQKRQERLSRWG